MTALALVVISVLMSVILCKRYDVKLSQVYFDGGFMVFPVKRVKLQQRLDEVNTQFDNDVKLALPSKPILQDLITEDEHVVMFSYGHLDALAFKDALPPDEKNTVSTEVDILGIDIPYLTSERGRLNITFEKDLFTPDVGDYIQASVILPTPKIADRFDKAENGNTSDIQFEKGELQLHLTGIYNKTITNDDHSIEDVEEYESELQISQSGPDFSICEQFKDIQVDLCDIYRNPLYNAALKRAGTNVCIYWEPTADVKNQRRKFSVESISTKMKALLLLEEEQNVVEGSVQRGTFDIRLVFPCIK
ncbi:hypothetical protein HOLleu_00410 [Holothuria leucospilota]|uniref:Uncharacterized protein n=1 Tax=Holothuria leucospilota TaxID=206669 RepID=A0A9Q1CPK8_HOLLE|nr:hypothetical protein HOLleu_00410 [Holothuria leucospilota]